MNRVLGFTRLKHFFIFPPERLPMPNDMDALVETKLRQLATEEFQLMLREAKERTPTLEKDLEDLRKKLMPEAEDREGFGVGQQGVRRPERRVQINAVADILDVPVNDLMLYFLNHVKTKNERSLVEYRMSAVYFYAAEPEAE